ncbi:hypothetical protein Bbelb_091300 [Branchiostoma belcheri]|nr:hypothetical protein Bbelb_091300 [Branchiostoma belcheri]
MKSAVRHMRDYPAKVYVSVFHCARTVPGSSRAEKSFFEFGDSVLSKPKYQERPVRRPADGLLFWRVLSVRGPGISGNKRTSPQAGQTWPRTYRALGRKQISPRHFRRDLSRRQHGVPFYTVYGILKMKGATCDQFRARALKWLVRGLVVVLAPAIFTSIPYPSHRVPTSPPRALSRRQRARTCGNFHHRP